VLGDVTEPQLIRCLSPELVPGDAVPVDDGAEVIVDRRTGLLAVLPAPLPERRPPTQLRADPPRGPLSHRLAGLFRFVGQEPVAELWVVTVVV
jgi:hypothetical protein